MRTLSLLKKAIRRSGKKNVRSFELCQPFLVKKFVELVGLAESVESRDTPVGLPLLHKDLKGLKRKQSWNYIQWLGCQATLKDPPGQILQWLCINA
eukprot:7780494-Ditylum_brightwellii.AAC.2